MKKVMNIRDLKNLERNSALPSPLLQYLEGYFHQLYQALSDGESFDEFSLEQHGYFVVLDSDDNVRDLHEVGLNLGDNGLLGCWPEYVEKLKLYDKSEWTKLAVLYDNDYMMFFFLQPTDFDEEVQTWLSDKIEDEIPFCGSVQTATSIEE